ncbi:MAG: D-alanyl-D-alanine carboxypeptidase family protein [Spirochaetota bacterium]
MSGSRGWTSLAALTLALALAPHPISASTGKAPQLSAITGISARSVAILDEATGSLLYSKDPDLVIPPASLAKLVTLHLVYRELDAGRLSRDELVTIDKRDCSPYVPFGSSLMYLQPGMKVSVIDLMRGAAVVSGNDAAFALARRIAGSNEDFARLMNSEVERLGFTKLRFVEPSGLSEKNLVTAREFAAFCRLYLRLHPGALAELHSLRSIEFPRPEHATVGYTPVGRIIQRNKNSLVLDYPGCDGLKTGYIIEAGFNLAATAERDGTRFVIVTLGGGGSSSAGGGEQRTKDGSRLLDWAFANWKTAIPNVPAIPPLRAWYGATRDLRLEATAPLAVTLPPPELTSLSVRVEIPRYVEAPIEAGARLGSVIYTSGSTVVRRVDLVATSSVARGNVFVVIRDAIQRFFIGLFERRAPKA